MLMLVSEGQLGRAARVRREIFLTRGMLVITLVASGLLLHELASGLLVALRVGAVSAGVERSVFLVIATVLLYGTVVYQLTRIGQLRRRLTHRTASRALLERAYDEVAPAAVTILVPSFCEEPDIVRRTLISAAVQDYPNRRVVLLIDDPARPVAREARGALHAARRLPGEVAGLLEKPARRFATTLAEFIQRQGEAGLDRRQEACALAELHAEAAAWFDSLAKNSPGEGASERSFRDVTSARPAQAHRERSRLYGACATGAGPPTEAELLHEHRYLAGRFRAEVACFERKLFANLSHEPNKAMNLNAYLGLMGGSFCERQFEDGVHLVPAAPGAAEVVVPDAEFVVTLDADSLLAHDYVLRLVQWLRAPGRERVAVVQTPYSAFPGAAGTLEYIAGATTDIQYLIHQGFTHYGATYWVGANALLRCDALRELRSERTERGHAVPVFIQDRTVIEDTESTIDLIARGWTLHNYPERLAWSATPSDFGALLIQRRRWANGGLIILPKLLWHLSRQASGRGAWTEGFLRIHYLVSIAGVNLALLALIFWPFEDSLRSYWFPAAALPYFFLYGRDLVQLNYRGSDLVRAYALNLLLLPINLAGVVKSLQQVATGGKTPFSRTPKVPGRTPAPALYHVAEWGLLVGMVGALLLDLAAGRWFHAAFLTANGALFGWALVSMVGPSVSLDDLRLQAATWSGHAREIQAGVRKMLRGGLAATAALSIGLLLVGLLDHEARFTTPESIARSYGLPLLAACLAVGFWVLPRLGRLLLASLLMTIVCLDFGLRLAADARDPTVETGIDPEYYQDHARFGYSPKPGVVTSAWKRVNGETVYDVEYAIDGLGRRITPHAETALRDRYLLGFGGSFMFGEGVNPDETLPFEIARLAAGHRAYNYGFHGYGPAQLLARLEEGGLRAEVDEEEGELVYLFIDAHVQRAIGSFIVHTGWAHAAPYYVLDEAQRPARSGSLTSGRPATALVYSLLDGSGLLRWLRADLPLQIGSTHIDFTARLLARSRELFREQFGDQRFSVIIYPGSAYGERLALRLAALGVDTLDYSELFDPSGVDYFIREDWHPSATAYRELAERLVTDLRLN